MSSSCQTVVHTAQVDLATASPLIANLAGGGKARAMFHKKHIKSNWYSLVPHPHSLDSGSAGFDQKCSWKLGRQGDYLQASWLRIELASVKAAASFLPNGTNDGQYLRWCHNLAHNLIECVELSFTGIPGASFTNFFFDFFAAFTVPGGKRNGYDNMIGNIPELVNPIYSSSATAAQVLPAAVLNLPIPMPYTRDTGIALPTGALIYNDVLMEFHFRKWTELLVVSNPTTAIINGVNAHSSRNALSSDVDSTTIPSFKAQLWGTYAVVSTDERKRMGKVPRDMIWENVQTMPESSIISQGVNIDLPLRYSHAVKALFFAIRNTTVDSDRSNYTTREPLARLSNGATTLEFPAPNAFDPIESVCLLYEGSSRLADMPIDYFSLVQAYLYARSIPVVTGYHLYSYSLDMFDTNHLGSVDYGKLTNVTLRLKFSDDTKSASSTPAVVVTPFVNELGIASALPPGYGTALVGDINIDGANNAASYGGAFVAGSGFNEVKQTFEGLNCCLAHNILRVIGGGAGFPIF